MAETIRLAMLASGGGSTVAAILDAINEKELTGIEPVLIIASRSDAGVIEKARVRGIAPEDILVIRKQDHKNEIAFGKRIADECWKRRVGYIGQYGWIPKTPGNVLFAYDGKMINQHPGALDPGNSTPVERHPDFGGPGMYGRRVIAAALYFARMTGHNQWVEATAHLVFPVLDSGPLIRFKRVDIDANDTVESIQARLLPVEHQVQIEALADLIAHGHIRTVKRPEPLILRQHYGLLAKAKKQAVADYSDG